MTADRPLPMVAHLCFELPHPPSYGRGARQESTESKIGHAPPKGSSWESAGQGMY